MELTEIERNLAARNWHLDQRGAIVNADGATVVSVSRLNMIKRLVSRADVESALGQGLTHKEAGSRLGVTEWDFSALITYYGVDWKRPIRQTIKVTRVPVDIDGLVAAAVGRALMAVGEALLGPEKAEESPDWKDAYRRESYDEASDG